MGRREPEVSSDEVQAELERLRESLASLETVEREAGDGDFLVLDFTGTVDGEPFEGGEARGYLLELGSGRLIPGFEEQLEGAKAGDEREVKVTFPDDYPAEHLAGKEASFAVRSRRSRRSGCPSSTTSSRSRPAASTPSTSCAPTSRRACARPTSARSRASSARPRWTRWPPRPRSRSRTSWSTRRPTRCGTAPRGAWPSRAWTRQRYLELTGKTEEELVTEAEPEAETALRREAVLAAVVEQEGIEVSDEEVTDALKAAAAGEGGREPSEKQLQRSLKRLKAQGADEALREDIAMRKAVDLIVEHAKAIPVEQAKAREKLWTPDKEEKEAAGAGQIWTPGDDR